MLSKPTTSPLTPWDGVEALLPNAAHDQSLREGGEDLGCFRPARPHRQREALDPDVAEAERSQLGHRPLAGAGLGLGSGEALADLGGQPFGDVPGIIILERRVAERRDFAWDLRQIERLAGWGRGGCRKRLGGERRCGEQERGK